MDMYTPFLLLFILLTSSAALVSANFYSDFDITWGNDRAKILDNGQQLQLTLDRTSGNKHVVVVMPLCNYRLKAPNTTK
jgi:hypothetical protein